MGGLSVIGELASIGYDAEWRVVSAASVGANHRRDRIIIVAYPSGQRLETTGAEFQTSRVVRGSENSGQFVADTDDARGGTPPSETNGDGEAFIERREIVSLDGVSRRSTNVADSTGSDGRVSEPYGLRQVFRQASELRELSSDLRTIGYWWETEPDVGRVANGVSDRVDRLRGLGNAVVPQVAEVIGRLVISDYQSRED
jgi:DNA (cytosine-5)-methyltransferase 1